MKKFSVILLTLVLVSAGARAVELMKWERIPLQIPLTVGQERIVFVNKNVRVGFPPALNDKLRIQSSGGVVYLDAKEAFPVTRLELQNKENGEILLLDVSAAPVKPRGNLSKLSTTEKWLPLRRPINRRSAVMGTVPAVSRRQRQRQKAGGPQNSMRRCPLS